MEYCIRCRKLVNVRKQTVIAGKKRHTSSHCADCSCYLGSITDNTGSTLESWQDWFDGKTKK